MGWPTEIHRPLVALYELTLFLTEIGIRVSVKTELVIAESVERETQMFLVSFIFFYVFCDEFQRLC